MGKRIIFIDDDDTLRQMHLRNVRRELAKAAIQADEAANGKDALDIILASRDEHWLIVSDLHMPCLNGLQLFRLLGNQEPPLHATKILTSAGGLIDCDIIAASGADAFYEKEGMHFARHIREAVLEFLAC